MDFSKYNSTHPFLVLLWKTWINQKYKDYKKSIHLCKKAFEKTNDISDEEIKQVFLYCYLQILLKQ